MELTQRRLNRALLARQLLLERRRLPLTAALERLAGLQAQYAPSAYIGLWARLDGFRLDDLTRALARRRAVQASLMRATIHIVSRRDYWPFATAIHGDLRAWWERTHRRHLGDVDLDAVDAAVREALADGPRRRDELIDVVRPFGPEHSTLTWNAVTVELVRAPPSGTWERRRADLLALADEWIGPPEITARAAAEHLVRRYLDGFGPASVKDAAGFTGLSVTTLKPVLAALRLRRFQAEDGEELLDLPKAPLPDPETPAPPRFLPTWDATLLVHARRTGLLPEEHRSKLFAIKTPHSFPSFLVDGAVAGKWRFERGRIELEPFGRLDASTRRALAAAAERLAELHVSPARR
jgi:hypothetical protein